MDGYAIKADGSYRAVTDETPLEEGETFVVALPDLSNSEVELQLNRVEARFSAARSAAANIPSWATWSQAEWDTYFDANLSDVEVAKVTSLATARVMIERQNTVINNLSKMIIALRDQVWPDLPET